MEAGELSETTIPLLPCHSLDETIEFYEVLGFEVTHRQVSPYLYAAVRRGGVELHSSTLSVYGARKAFGAYLVFVTGIAAYHRAFADGLRLCYGTIPTAGLPRLARLRPGQTRFHLFDPSGNMVIYSDRDEKWAGFDEPDYERSSLVLALEKATFLRDTYANDPAAAKVLDAALGRQDEAEPPVRNWRSRWVIWRALRSCGPNHGESGCTLPRVSSIVRSCKRRRISNGGAHRASVGRWGRSADEAPRRCDRSAGIATIGG